MSHLERSLGENLPEHYLGLTNVRRRSILGIPRSVSALSFCSLETLAM